MEAMSIINLIKLFHIDVLLEIEAVNVRGNQTKRLSVIRCALRDWDGLGKDGNVVMRGARGALMVPGGVFWTT